MTESEAHQFFSAHCFNDVWRLLEIESRTDEESSLMRDTAHASLYHWKQREDCEPQNLSIGLWLLARVYSVLGNGEEAMHYAVSCIEISETAELAPFYLGYAFEAATRAAKTSDLNHEYFQYLEKAKAQLSKIEDEEEKAMLEKDLIELER